MSNASFEIIQPDSFQPQKHFYDRTLNAHLHPLVKHFLTMSNERILNRYCHLHPEVNKEKLENLLKYQPSHFRWAGADLFPVTTAEGERKMVLIETNSCPSGQKSMPLYDDTEERGGYCTLIKNSFMPLVKKKRLPEGALAVLFDKNPVEAGGYASAIADLSQEPVYLIKYYNSKEDQGVKFDDGILYIKDGDWKPMRAVFKYVTQKPWNRIPLKSKTLIYNSMISCLAGGRNKLMASKAYDLFNGEMNAYGLEIRTPDTINDISKAEVPLWINHMGGVGVIKNPYSNAGQGVYTITNKKELDAFMAEDHDYDLFIVQSLIGNSTWTSKTKIGQLYHIGTIPNKRNKFYVADLRMMIYSGPEGYRPVAIYGRQAKLPLINKLEGEYDSWGMLGTNLSRKLGENSWASETERLILMDHRDFNKLGIGIDDLIEGFIQTLLAAISIDTMSINLLNTKGNLKKKLFRSLNTDRTLIEELYKDD
ncbi:MAG: hypothetical protein INQ03_19145 [Candidatus Heimdallarchaeota archaeon]|nr:hypothetical protein [Candidatus Heimdallarchaeota archaeon]